MKIHKITNFPSPCTKYNGVCLTKHTHIYCFLCWYQPILAQRHRFDTEVWGNIGAEEGLSNDGAKLPPESMLTYY